MRRLWSSRGWDLVLNLLLLSILTVIVAYLVHLVVDLPGWFWHPLGNCTPEPNCKGYQLWSGVASDIGEVTLATGLLVVLKHMNCGNKGCWRMGYRHPEHGHHMCGKHILHTPHSLIKHHGAPVMWGAAQVHLGRKTRAHQSAFIIQQEEQQHVPTYAVNPAQSGDPYH